MNDQLIIVTGAHLRAEIHDRPIAYALREAMLERMDLDDADSGEGAAGRGLDRVVVCSDLWYLNQAELRGLPTIAVGGPDVNALTASLADRLASVFVVDGAMIVQMTEDESEVPVACCWGVGPRETLAAVEVFVERFSGGFLERVGL